METLDAAVGTIFETTVFLDHFSDLPDRRQAGKVTYPLDEILLLSLLAVLAGAEGVGQQPVAHGRDLVAVGGLGTSVGGAEGGGDSRGLRALGPPDLPNGQRGLLGEGDLNGVARLQGVEEAVDVPAEFGLVLPRQDGQSRGHAVLDCI